MKISLVIGSAVLLAAMLSGQNTSRSNTAGAVSSADESFVIKAAHGGMEEVEMGKMAAQKATDPRVRQFGQRMVDDHSRANDELMAIARQKGIEAGSMSSTDSNSRGTTASANTGSDSKMQKMSGMSGAQFDRAYMRDMVSDHENDVAEFEQASRTVKDADLKAFIDKTLPTLREHLSEARNINQSLGR